MNILRQILIFIFASVVHAAIPLLILCFVVGITVILIFQISSTIPEVLTICLYVIGSYITVSLISYKFSSIVAFFLGGRRLLTKEREFLFPALQEVAERLRYHKGINISVIDDQMEFNAFVVGTNMVFTSSLINSTSQGEIRAIIAHEYAHLKYGDSYFASVRAFLFIPFRLLVGGIDGLTQFFQRMPFLLVIWLPFILVSTSLKVLNFIVGLIILSESRSSEFRADRFSQENGYYEGLKSFLEQAALKEGKKNWFESVMNTHPSAAKRILKLENNFRGMQSQITGA